ncbi:serine/threonine-protein phosphatase 6 regulatory subunit 2 isoform X2 [Pantherophis guttatus]|uniref:Serine/threonine-protein phosphatase 6 regulatory subunit 2 isoform X2 n=1 Tax=Pantherophis guttatus TaxID=94885 RepID=A0ABM3Z9M1_PANGU|nr:serine/threonine-protein phosphatase 6 regulatory subunit 2 isoform X2 [Pantherophis guttatus]
MFWKFDLNTTSHVDKLLEKEDVTLRELMDEDDVLQECKAQNRKLVDFLCRQPCMEELVQLITRQPPLDVDEKVRFKYPNTACELLTSDVPQISDRLGGDEALWDVLYGFLDQEPPLNPLLASFFSKTIGSLIARKAEQVISFLRKKAEFIDLVLKHLETSAMMDLLLRLVSCVEPAPLRQEVLQWLNDAKLVQRLLELIRPHQDEDRQSNASQTLCDIIRLSRDQSNQFQEVADLDPLLASLESQECVEQLLKNVFDEGLTETCVVNGTQVLLTLLEPRRAGLEGLSDSFSQGFEKFHPVSSCILQGIKPRLKDFHQLLLQPPKMASILTTIGILEEPLGNARLHGARLVAALLHTNTPSINQELCRLNIMDLLLDLFFKYTWNNFLHFQVELCITAILMHSVPGSKLLTESEEEMDGNVSWENAEAPENLMLTHLFQRCCLVQRILDAWETNDKIQAEGGMRRGNMGHLTRIANTIVQTVEKGPGQSQIREFIRGLPEDCRGRWESFVEETLVEANRRNTVDLVTAHHLHSSSEDEEAKAAFPNEVSLQQAFSEYQVQQMTAIFMDQFGFNDEEFADQDDNINAPFDRIAEINFSIDVDDDSASASLFETCCSERIQQFDDSEEEEEEEEDIWEENDTNYAAQAKSRSRFGGLHSVEGSGKGSLENGEHDGCMDSGEEEAEKGTAAHSEDPWKAENQATDPSSEGSGWRMAAEPVKSKPPASWVATDIGSSVWDSVTPGTKAPEERGWAKFPDFQPFCCSEAAPRCSSPVDNDSEGSAGQSQDENSNAASPCAWNVCVARKAPLVASDSSSSGDSDSEEEEEAASVVTETISTGSGQETVLLTVDTKNEKALFISNNSVTVDKLASPLTGEATPALDILPHSAAAAVTPEAKRDSRNEEPHPGTEAPLKGPA